MFQNGMYTIKKSSILLLLLTILYFVTIIWSMAITIRWMLYDGCGEWESGYKVIYESPNLYGISIPLISCAVIELIFSCITLGVYCCHKRATKALCIVTFIISLITVLFHVIAIFITNNSYCVNYLTSAPERWQDNVIDTCISVHSNNCLITPFMLFLNVILFTFLAIEHFGLDDTQNLSSVNQDPLFDKQSQSSNQQIYTNQYSNY